MDLMDLDLMVVGNNLGVRAVVAGGGVAAPIGRPR
jgi:hypothetical protein